MKKKRNAMLFEGIPPTVRAKFKSVCARRGVTMREAVVHLMRVYASAAFPSFMDGFFKEANDNKSVRG
jgi:hypothetical protein